MAAIESKLITHVGPEKIEVPGGTFTTEHLTISAPAMFRAPLHVWVRPTDCLLVKCSWEVLESDYLLVAYAERDPQPLSPAQGHPPG